MPARVTALANRIAFRLVLVATVAVSSLAARTPTVAGFWTSDSVACDGQARPELPAPLAAVRSAWATSRGKLTIAPGNSEVTIVDAVGGVMVFSTAGVPERHDIGGVGVWVTTRLEPAVLNQRIESAVGTPSALIWSLNIEDGQLVATLSVENALGHPRMLERRLYRSDAVR
jgi:hypothetical protein